MSSAIEGLVETSSNLGIVETSATEIRVVALTRSSRGGALESVQERMARSFEAAGATVSFAAHFPAWEADVESPLVRRAVETFVALFGQSPQIKAVHGGLECGVIGSRVPGVQMISFGPEIRAAHTGEAARPF